MDLNLLSVFVKVAEASSFASAARALGLRRSSVSRAVGALEKELGVQLFSRTTRTVALTTAGAALHARVAPQLAALREAAEGLPEREDEPSGQLRLTAPADMVATFLPRAIAGFCERHPRVQVDLRLTSRRTDLVAEGFDVALRVAVHRLSDSTIVARKLTDLELQLYAAPSYLRRAGAPRTIAEAAEHPFVLLSQLQYPPPLQRSKARPRVVSDDMLFLSQMVKAGLGLGLLTTFVAQEDLAGGRLVRVLPKVSVRAGALYLVHPPAQHLPRKVTAFRDHLVGFLGENPIAGDVEEGR
ncbi:MAG: LysR substrate-binding domain-containing protein [Myxococcales bacterium]